MRALAVLGAFVVACSSAAAGSTKSADRWANGRLVYGSDDLSALDGFGGLVVSDPNGARRKTILTPEDSSWYTEPSWSPDGTKIAVAHQFSSRYGSGGSLLYVLNADGSGRRLIAHVSGRSEGSPAWSFDGRRLAYVTGQSTDEVWVVNSDRTGKRRLTQGQSPAWSPDGRRIAFTRFFGDANEYALFILELDGLRVTQLTSGPDRLPDWSPDGELIAFQRGTSGGGNIHVMKPDGTGLRQLTRGCCNTAPAWSPDGAKIAFTCRGDICVINSNGTGLRNITRTPSMQRDEREPDWQPVRVVGGTMIGTRFADYLVGGSGREVILGHAGDDVIAGGLGSDLLNGGAGSDVLYAQDRERDVIAGGAGRDRAFADRRDRVLGVERVVLR